MRGRFAFLALLLLASSAGAELVLNPIFSDHAVLQSQTPLPVWGRSDPGQPVTVRLGDATAQTTADDAGNWRVTLPELPAGGAPLELTVSANQQTVVRKDILIGDVWLGSGQSNMDMALRRTDDAESFIKSADLPQVRLFKVARKASTRPVAEVGGKWVLCSPDSAARFSAVLFHFGRELHTRRGVPVGLIQSSWGGTPIQSWMPPDAFSDSDLDKHFQRIAATYPVATQPQSNRSEHLRPAHLYNGMIAPLKPYAIGGVVWYQGENNVHQDDIADYATMLDAMVRCWRTDWPRRDWPFLIVQLAPFGDYRSRPDALPEMWEQQARALDLIPRSSLIGTSDLGNANDIHPTRKREIGQRLARVATADNRQLTPVYASHAIEGDRIRIRLSGAANGMGTLDGAAATGIEIAGPDNIFVPANAKLDGNDILIWSERIAEPAAARYAWSPAAIGSLINSEGLPAVPFRTRGAK